MPCVFVTPFDDVRAPTKDIEGVERRPVGVQALELLPGEIGHDVCVRLCFETDEKGAQRGYVEKILLIPLAEIAMGPLEGR